MFPAVVRIAAWPCRWFFGLDRGYLDATGSPAPKTVYSEVISLFALLVTNAIALTISLQQTNAPPGLGLSIAYAIIPVAVIAGMVIILNAEATHAKPIKYFEASAIAADSSLVGTHAYERGSIMFTRVFLLATLCLVFSVGILAFAVQLPGQAGEAFTKTIEIKPDKTTIYPFQDTKKDGLVVSLLLGKAAYPSGVPAQIEVEITLDKSLGKWVVQDVVGFIEPDGKEKMKYQPFLDVPDPKSPNRWPVSLEGLEKDKEYRIKIFLHPPENESPSAEGAKQLIESGRGIKCLFKTKPASK